MDGKVLQDAVIAPNDNWSAVLTPGQTLRIVDLEGKQAVDFLCYNAEDVADRYNAADTMKYNKNVYLGAGYGIYSERATKLFTIVADTMGGGHDTIGGCCSAASNMFRYKVPGTPSCCANFLRALAAHSCGRSRAPVQRVQPHADPRGGERGLACPRRPPAVRDSKILDAMRALAGPPLGHRRVHAKGLVCAGTLRASAEASGITRAPHFAGEPVPTIIRYTPSSSMEGRRCSRMSRNVAR